MDVQQLVFLAILTIILVLLVTEWIRLDLTAMFGVVALVVCGILTPQEALAGFGSEPAIAVAAVFVLSGGLRHTGMTDRLGDLIARWAGTGLLRATVVVMLCVAAMSAFTHHLMITAMMIPVTLGIGRKANLPASKLLMPMSLAASLGTTMTVIGAPAFLIASHLLARDGGAGLTIFSLTPIGVATVIATTLFMATIGRFMLPTREGNLAADDHFRLDNYYTEIVVEAASIHIGKAMSEFQKTHLQLFDVVDWLRHGSAVRRPFSDMLLEENDVSLVRTNPDLLASISDEPGLALHAVAQYGKDLPKGHRTELHGDERLVQVLVAPHSELIGRTLAQIDFHHRYNLVVVGLWRKRSWLRTELSQVRLRAGDALVLWGEQDAFARINDYQEFLMTVPFHGRAIRRDKGPLAVSVLIGAVVLAAADLVSVQIAFLAGALAMILGKCLSPRQAYDSIEAKVFVFIAGAIPLGLAMEKTGVSSLFANWLAQEAAGLDPIYVLAAMFVSGALLTQILSDAATVVLLGPIALGLAQPLGIPPEPLVVCTALGAVAAFLTPIGHHGNLLIYGPGNYRFGDFIRIGLPVTIIVGVISCTTALVLWPVK